MAEGDLSTEVPGVVRLRDQREALTRRTILHAARRIFAERGYTATGVRLLAQAAGVSPQTIYATYGSKAGVLTGLPDLVDEEAGIIDLFEARQDTQDPVRLVGLLAQISRQVQQRCGDILKILQTAEADPAIAAALAESSRRQRLGVHAILARVHAAGALSDHLTLAHATDIAVALMGNQVCDTLVQKSSWSYDEYEDWLATSLAALVLSPRRRRRTS